MLKSEKASMKKGRWLVLEQTGHTTEEVLALIRSIDGAEIQIIDTKTYVRFPERRAQTVKHLSKVSKMLRLKHKKLLVEGNETESPRQYCAIILKNGR